jgi:hypothetical protein
MPVFKRKTVTDVPQTIRRQVELTCRPYYGSSIPLDVETAADRQFRQMPPVLAREFKWLRNARRETVKLLAVTDLNSSERSMVERHWAECDARIRQIMSAGKDAA